MKRFLSVFAIVDGKRINLYSMGSKKILQSFSYANDFISNAEFSSDSKYLMADIGVGKPWRNVVWDIASKKIVSEATTNEQSVITVGNDYVVSASYDGDVRVRGIHKNSIDKSFSIANGLYTGLKQVVPVSKSTVLFVCESRSSVLYDFIAEKEIRSFDNRTHYKSGACSTARACSHNGC